MTDQTDTDAEAAAAAAAAAPAAAPERERLETRYLIYSTEDMGKHVELLGEQLATSSSQARTRFCEPGDQRHIIAVSENHFKIHIPPPRIGG